MQALGNIGEFMKHVYLIMFVLFCQLSFAGENYEIKIKLELRTYIQDSIKVLSEKKESENLDLFFPKFIQERPNYKIHLGKALNKIDENRVELIENFEYILDKSFMFFQLEKNQTWPLHLFLLMNIQPKDKPIFVFFMWMGNGTLSENHLTIKSSGQFKASCLLQKNAKA